MKRRLLITVMVVAVIFASLPVYAQGGDQSERTGFRPDAPPYGVRGPYPVGFMTFSDGVAERPMEGGIWYPAANPEGVEETIIYDLGIGDLVPPLGTQPGYAIMDGTPDAANGPYPLIISSHGMGGQFYSTAYLHEHLASQGFVVMAMYHPGNTFRDNLLVGTDEQQMAFIQAAIDSMVLRPLDVTQTLDYAQVLTSPGGALAGVINMDQVATLGLSFGGATAVLAGGARLDFRPLPELCAPDVYASMLTTMICQVYGADLPGLETHLLEVAGVEASPGQLWPSLGDPRIDAIVALMPGGSSVHISEEGYASVLLPMLLFRSGNDELAVPEYNVDQVWQYSGSPSKTLVTLENAGHMVAGQCPPAAVAAIPAFFPSCSDAVWDTDRAHDLIDHFVTAFLLAELYGDADSAAALAPDAANFPGITYETTGF